ncbi:Bifunctional uridylyltransferase/uridylyl-removing enzyme [bacterium HR10]|nr:Bifunctional uridylyltransferase/uridylyl-removing enzyme [bacterium HR10]
MDLIVCQVAEWASARVSARMEIARACALVAVGGYGRCELAPFSDVDLAFVHVDRAPEELRAFIEQVLRLLWDGGLVIGHSVRSIGESVHVAREDPRVATALQETRYLWGSPAIVRQLRESLQAALYEDRRQRLLFLEALRREWEQRYARMGEIIGVQEPHVKEGAGGLRDLHAIRWVGRARYGSAGIEALCAEGHVSSAEYAVLRSAHDFLLRVRNGLHFLTGRKTDRLTVDLQLMLAARLGYPSWRGLRASEVFMREYYHQAHSLHEIARGFLARAWRDITRRRLWAFRGHRRLGAFEIAEGELFLREEREQPQVSPVRDPLLLVEAFRVAQTERVTLSEELRRTIREHAPVLGRILRQKSEARQLFLQIVGHRGEVARVLRLMHETGVLGRFLPEFGRLTFLVQHDPDHAYTVDEHTFQALEALDRVWQNPADAQQARLRQVFSEITDAVPLYLGLLFHDLGKGRGHGHVPRSVRLARRALRRLGLGPQRQQAVLFLVARHLLMSHLAWRRDVTEEGVIAELVAALGEGDQLERLNMLLLLTYADTAGVGPGVWTQWKGLLLWELYERARRWLTRQGEGEWLPIEEIARVLDGEFSRSEIERHLAELPPRYGRATPPEQIAEHLRLVRRVPEEFVVVRWRTVREGGCTELTLSTFDQLGLFARIAGTLWAHGLNILSAEAYTRADGIIIDTFRVCEIGSACPVSPERWAAIEADVRAAVDGCYDVARAVAKWQRRSLRPRARDRRAPLIRCDNAASLTSTVLEVVAEDEPGLAYRIASTLQALGLTIVLAKVTTEKSLALDVFYVTDAEGRKLTPAFIAEVERALAEALSVG